MDKMTLQERQLQCERDNAFNERMERQLQKVNKKNTDCNPTETEKYSKCCSLSPVVPTPVISCSPCEPERPTSNRFCTKVRNVCQTVELTAYGKEFDRNTGRTIPNCQCIKFNGLQDTCQHPECKPKVGCMDNPFPNCPPAQLWKKEYKRNNRKTDEC